MSKHVRRLISLGILSLSWLLPIDEFTYMAVWPSVVAVSIVFLLRSALMGLLAGAVSGVLLLCHGNPIVAYISFFKDHLIPSLQSQWNISVIIFTLLMGGFVGLIEFGGGITGVLHGFLNTDKKLKNRVQWSAYFLGFICFFDGLANSMLVGRVVRPLADYAGVSRQKLAYIVDSTSSPIACVAVISTWIAYQLSMIREGLLQFQIPGNPYIFFLKSIPHNFYCLYTLILVAIVIHTNCNFASMGAAESKSSNNASTFSKNNMITGHWARAAIPLVMLIVLILVGLFISGSENGLPSSLADVSDAFGNADTALVLVCATSLSCLVAFATNISSTSRATAGSAFLKGMIDLFVPILILISAWCLSSVLKQLGASEIITCMLSGNLSPRLLPATVFVAGVLISFSTGTSWGTIGVLMPLVLPSALTLSSSLEPQTSELIIAGTIAAVFSGAVFGDHCSPISDTTIVSSIACGCEPAEHVRTQLPYALLAAFIALFVGFIPAGYGCPPGVLLFVGTLIMIAACRIRLKFSSHRS